jgi:hypothetical protein
MTGLVRRFCPRCGTARVAEMPFCPACGLNLRELDEGSDPLAGPDPGAAPPTTDSGVASGVSTPQADPSQAPSVDEWETGSHDVTLPVESTRPASRGLRVHPIVLIAAIVVVVLVLVGLLPRPQLPGPGSGGPPASGVASGAPIVGLTILSPTDGQAVAAKDVLVIGLAPPGLTITQDISFGFDQHATTDGTGHWAIKVGLNEGDNKLTFRIGDDHSTQQTIRVIYTPPASP